MSMCLSSVFAEILQEYVLLTRIWCEIRARKRKGRINMWRTRNNARWDTSLEGKGKKKKPIKNKCNNNPTSWLANALSS